MKKLVLIAIGMAMLMASLSYAAEEPAKAPTPAQVPTAAPAAPASQPAQVPTATPAAPAAKPAQAPTAAPAPPVAGSETVILGVSVTELTNVVKGWSVKKKVLGKTVYNDKNQKIGKVEDIIIAPDRVVTYAIIGVGGFLGIDRNDVAIPIKQFKVKDNKFILPGATKETIKKMPTFKYAK